MQGPGADTAEFSISMALGWTELRALEQRRD